jgi:hypothetical protein
VKRDDFSLGVIPKDKYRMVKTKNFSLASTIEIVATTGKTHQWMLTKISCLKI